MLLSTGLTRSLDPLGRIVIPMDVRRRLGLREGVSLEILTGDDESIVLRKILSRSSHSALISVPDEYIRSEAIRRGLIKEG